MRPRAWRGWWPRVLFSRRPLRLVFSLGLLGLALLSATALLPPLVAAALVAAVCYSLDELLLPVDYRLTHELVRARTWLRTRRYEWGEFTQAVATEFGVLLRSPVRRSIHLLQMRDRDQLLDECRERLAEREAHPDAAKPQ